MSRTSPVVSDVRGRISLAHAARTPAQAQAAREDSEVVGPEGSSWKMKGFLVLMLISHAWARGLPEDSVVSDYTTGTLNVYSQIASNIAERITQPIYRFFGVNYTTTTIRPFEHIELLEPEPENTTKDREELSPDALSKPEKKPEKITLYNTYLPVKDNKENTFRNPDIPEKISLYTESQKLEDNDTISSNEIDDFDIDVEDENDQETPRGPFLYFLELFGSILQLLWGGFLAIFKPSSSSDSDTDT